VTGPLTDDLTTHVVQPDVLAQNGRRPGTGLLPLVVVLVLVAAAVMTQRRAAPAPTASFSGSVLAAAPHTLVAQLSRTGGLAGNLVTTRINPPLLAVHGDGTVVAGGNTVLRLSPAEVSDLVSGLRVQLAGYGRKIDAPEQARRVLDADDVTLGVYDGGRMRTVTAYALDNRDGYPARLLAALDRLDRLMDRVLTHGTPYRADGVRLMVVPWVGIGPPAVPWPVRVPLPPVLPGQPVVRQADLRGSDLAAVVRTWPPRRAGDPAGSHTAVSYRLPDGTVGMAFWRYLLPSELGR
jgi:hypothetical protein